MGFLTNAGPAAASMMPRNALEQAPEFTPDMLNFNQPQDQPRNVFQAAQEPPKRRVSALNVLGQMADWVAQTGGAEPMYQPSIDAENERARQAEQDTINNQYKQSLIGQNQFNQQQKQNVVMAQIARKLQMARDSGVPGSLDRLVDAGAMSGVIPPNLAAGIKSNPQMLDVFGMLAEQPGTEFKEIGNRLVAVRPDGSVEEVYAAPEKPKPVKQVTMVGPDGPGIYNIDEAGNIVGKAGDVVRAPTAPRQPTLADQRYQALVDSGMDPKAARLKALGLDKSGGGSNKAADKRAAQNDRIDVAATQVKQMLSGNDWQGGSGIGNALSDTWNAVSGLVGIEGSPERSRQIRDIATLRQVVTGALNDDERTTEGDFKRIDELLPASGLGSWFQSDKQARNAMADILKLMNEIRNRPLPGDPRAEGSAPPQREEAPLGGTRFKFNPVTGEIE